jgi:uncharacterized protein
MLTNDLLMARNVKGKIYPSYLKEKHKSRYLSLIDNLIKIFETHIGLTLDELDESIKSFYDASVNKKVLNGFIKLLKDRCEFAVESEISPEKIRRALFLSSTEHWKGLSVKGSFNRGAVLVEAGKRLDLTPKEIEEQMYADLKGSQVINSFKSITPQELFNRYNLSLAQVVLYKAIRVEIRIKKASAKQIRRLFQYIKFFRLIYTITKDSNGEYTIILDGPYSLFKSVQKYGYQMALFLPALLIADEWELKADLMWGKARKSATFELDNNSGLVSHYKADNLEMPDEAEYFFKQFQEKDSDWDIAINEDIISLKGKGVCVPDFVFTHKKTENKVYMEVFGYWSRKTVWKRIEMLEEDFPYPLILAVSKKLRISEKAVRDELPGQVYVYSNVIITGSILEILDSLSK